jgi:hypothetical protein
MTPTVAAGPSGARVFLAFAVLFILAAIPVLSVQLPPLLDYPNHLTRMAVLADGGRDAGFARYYQVHWALLPNLAMDAVVPVLARFMPLFLAGRLFLLLVFLVLAAGTVLLHRALWHRWSYWPLLGFLLLYNRILLWGFVNFLAGVGLALLAAALWAALEKRPAWRAVTAVPAALLVFFCHIEAYGLLVLILFGIELVPAWTELRQTRWRDLFGRTVAFVLPCILPAVIFLAGWQPSVGGVDYAHIWRKADLLFTVFDDYNRPFDILCFVVFLALFIWGFARGALGFAPRLKIPMLLTTLAYLTVPTTLYTGSAADRRVPVMLALLLIAGTAPRLWPPRRAVLIGASVAALLLVRWGVVEAAWLHADRVYRADLQVLSQLPEGARLAVAAPGDAIGVTAAPELHLPTLAVVLRHAFVPTVFAYPTQQPMILSGEAAALAARTEPAALWDSLMTGNRAAARAMLDGYGFVLMTDRYPVRPPATACLAFMAGSDRFRLYRIDRTAPGCAGP